MRHAKQIWVTTTAAALIAGAITFGTISAGGADEDATEPAAPPAVASVRTLSTQLAQNAADAAYVACTDLGHAVTVSVLGRDGALLALVRNDQASVASVDAATGKAYASVSFRSPSGALGQGALTNPGLLQMPGFVVLRGALPITSQGQVIGSIGVGGAPGGDIDEGCSQVGIDRIAAHL